LTLDLENEGLSGNFLIVEYWKSRCYFCNENLSKKYWYKKLRIHDECLNSAYCCNECFITLPESVDWLSGFLIVK